MPSVQEHYDTHLGAIYGWMMGDRNAALAAVRQELRDLGIDRQPKGWAVDLGAGDGLYAIPLAELGFSVLALDTCARLLDELKSHAAGQGNIETVCADLREFTSYCREPVQLILCMGDTLTHLPSLSAVERLFSDVSEALAQGGMFLATFRDYVSTEPAGPARFIPVRSDERQILTCFLEYQKSTVMVHDILHVRGEHGWEMKVSAYPKLRLDPNWAEAFCRCLGLNTRLGKGPRGMVRLIASRFRPRS